MVKFINIMFVLALILSMLILNFSVSAEACASDETELLTYPVCCDELCGDPVIEDCQLVVACESSADMPQFISKYYAENADFGPMSILEECFTGEGFTCSYVGIQSNPTCNGHFLSSYSCADDCENYTGLTPEPQDCYCGYQFVPQGHYCCYDFELQNYFSTPTQNLDCSPEPSYNLFTVSGTLDVTSTLQLPVEGFVPVGVSYSDYLINVDGNFEINNVPTGTYGLSFANADFASGDCIVCESEMQQIEIVSSDITTEGFTATCQVDSTGVGCENTVPPVIPEDCVLGECNALLHAICEEVDDEPEFVLYDLTNQEDYDYYCSPDYCLPYDSTCVNLECVPDGCNGSIPVNCFTPEQDPDVPPGGCNIDADQWCNITLGALTGDGWMTIGDQPGDVAFDYYCSVCPQDSGTCGASDCGDGVIAGIEDCDFGNTLEPLNGDWGIEFEGEGGGTCGPIIGNCGAPGSDNPCRCNAPVTECRNDSIEFPEDCEFDGVQSYGCDEPAEFCNPVSCQCQQQYEECDYTPANAIQGIETSIVTCTDQVLITVTVAQGCQGHIDGIQLYECSGDGCAPIGDLASVNNNIAELTYVFTEPNFNYNLKVGVKFQNEDILQMYDSIISLQSGNDTCMNWFNTNNNYECTNTACIDSDTFMGCSVNNILSEIDCNESEMCANINGNAQCINTSAPEECTACSGVSGMFSYNDRILNGISHDANCWGLFASPLENENGPFACYKDVLYSNVDKPNACAAVDSCYNYHSEDVCVNDPCKKELDNLGCEWVPYNLQTGRGVCKPKTEQFIDCNSALKFDFNNLFLYSEIFGLPDYASSSRVCKLYGDCYYKFMLDSGSTGEAKCVNQDELICDDLTNKDDCIGEDNNYAFNINNNTLIGYNYSANLISEESKCKWNEYECIRDADDNGVDDLYTSNPRFSFFQNNLYPIQRENIPAQRDFISPVSELLTEQFPDDNTFGLNPIIPYAITDNYYSIEGLNLYYCVDQFSNRNMNYEVYEASLTQPDCRLPQDQENWHKADSYPLVLDFENPGPYSLYFFSMDDSLNIEPLKAIDFIVNDQMPEINLDYSYETYPAIPDYINDLTIEFTVDTYSNEGAQCEAYLYNLVNNNHMPIAGSDETLMSAIGTSFHLEYYGLFDGNYFFNATCSDIELGNTVSLVEEVNIQGDTRIFDATPQYEVRKSTYIDISVKTHYNAVCYYMLRDNIFVPNTYTEIIDCIGQEGEDSDLRGGLTCGELDEVTEPGDDFMHLTNLDFNYPNNVSGAYVYDVACEIETIDDDGNIFNEIVEGNNADLIIFSQDYTPPVIAFSVKSPRLYGDEEYHPYSSSFWYYQPEIKFECIDNPYYPGGTFTVFDQDLIFGCADDSIFYQQTIEDPAPCPSDLSGYLVTNPYEPNPQISDPDISNNQNNGGNELRICYSGEDNNSPNQNTAPIIRADFRIDAVEPGIQSFNIYRQHAYGEPVTELHKAFYDVVIGPDEDLSSAQVSFRIVGSSYTPVDIPAVYDNETDLLIATLNMFRYPELLDQELDLSFNVVLIDEHDILGYHENCYTIHVNTLAPPVPMIEPIFGDYHKAIGIYKDLLGNNYPGIYHEINIFQSNTTYWNESQFSLQDMFYSNQEEIFLTGFTEETPLNLLLLIYDQIGHEYFDLETHDIYNQENTNGINEINNLVETVITNPDITNLNGSSIVYLNTQYDDAFADAMTGTYAKVPIPEEQFISFKSQGKRTAYEDYFKYYKVTNILRDDTMIPALTYLVLDTPLEFTLDKNVELELFDKTLNNVPRDYFNLQINKPYEFACGLEQGTNAYAFKVRGMYNTGMINDTQKVKLFIDNVAPKLRKSSLSVEGAYNDKTPLLKFNITEHACGSGIDLSGASIQLFDDEDNLYQDYAISEDNFLSIGEVNKVNLVHYEFEYQVEDELPAGNYEIKLNIKDYAGNEINPFYVWTLIINETAPTAPMITVLNSNHDYNPWDKKYFVSELPEVSLVFEEEVELEVVGLGFVEEFECDEISPLEFICTLPTGTTISEESYNIIIGAQYNEEVFYWVDTEIVLDTTAPSIIDTTLPLAIRSDGSRSFKINLDDAEQDIVINLSSEGLSYTQEDMSANPNRDSYAAYLNANYFNWVSRPEPYELTIGIFDRAMNSDSITETIFVDDDPPIIEITRFESEGVTLLEGGDPLNITTRDTTLIIEGTVHDSLIKSVCVSAATDLATIEIDEPCQYLCEAGEFPPGCIEQATGNFQFIFELVFPSYYETGTEIWNYINLVATDEAYNVGYETLAALMDWQPPILVGSEI